MNAAPPTVEDALSTDAALKPLLEVEDVSKTFGATGALRGVSLDVYPGEVHAVVGQNGCGKSTLVKILSGFHAADEGSGPIRIAGNEVNAHDAQASHAAGLRFVHQDLGLVGTLNALENLGLGRGYPHGFFGCISRKRERESATQRLDSLGYQFDLTAPVSSLKAAERTGIAVARALYDLDEARVLVIDEPTATLPLEEVDILFEAIERVRARGIGVIYISHRLDEVFAIADRVTVLRDGTRVGTYRTSDLDQDRLIHLMIGDHDLATARPASQVRYEEIVLEVEGLVGVTASDVSFSVHRGEVLGIAGLTGSGREELLSLVFGAARRAGSVRVRGEQIRESDPRASIKAGMGFVPPDRHALGSVVTMEVRENCTLTDLQRHAGRGGLHRRAQERAEVVGWIEALDVRPAWPEAPFAALSGGNQQKVVLAKWLRMKPAVLLLDEPTAGVDVGAKAAIHELSRQAADDGAAVVIASSDEPELCDTCDRVIVLRNGVISGVLTGADIEPRAIARLQL